MNKIFPLLAAIAVPTSLLASSCGGSGAECVLDKYPEAPAGATGVLHVSANCPSSGADGSALHPYPTITAALGKSTKGGTLLVAGGTYKENVSIDHDIAIVGPVTPGNHGDDAGIILQAPAPDALTVLAGANATLTGFHVEDAQGIGVWAKGGTATLSASKIEGTTTDSYQNGYGAASSEDGAIILQDVGITASEIAGAYTNGGTLTADKCDFSKNKGAGVRLDHSSADCTISNSTLTGNGDFGIGVFSSGAIILQNHITGTVPGAMKLGDGILAAGVTDDKTNMYLGDSSVTANGNVITDSARVGALMSKGASGIILQDNTISGSAKSALFGAGIWLQAGAGGKMGNTLHHNILTGNKFSGIGMSGDTHGIILQNNEVSGTTLGTIFMGITELRLGHGISLFNGANGKLDTNTSKNNARLGMILDGEAGGSATTVENNILTDNGEYGIILQNQPATAPTLMNNMASGNPKGDTVTIAAGMTPIDVYSADFATK